MPRQSRGSSSGGGRRPTAAPARPSAPMQPQSRQSSTAMTPAANQSAATRPPPQAGQQSPGLFGQMASTAAGVAVGSSIGHAIGGFFGGGSSNSSEALPAEQQQQQNQGMMNPADNNTYMNSQYQPPRACENDSKRFYECMDQNRGDLTVCGWYMDQLKACQAAARPY